MKKSDKRVRIQVFSGSSSQYKQFELSLNKLAVLCVAAALGLTLLVAGGVFVVNKVKNDVDLGSWVIEHFSFDSEVFAAELNSPKQSLYSAENIAFTGASSDSGDFGYPEGYTQNALIVDEGDHAANEPPSLAEDSSEISQAIGDLEKKFHAVLDFQDKLDLNPNLSLIHI